MEGRSLSGYQRKRVWLNDGAGRFTEVAQAVGAPTPSTAARSRWPTCGTAACSTWWWRTSAGRCSSTGTRSRRRTQWIEFELEGTASNRSAIGAQVSVYWDGQEQVQEVSGGSGFCAQNQRRLHFGLGKGARVERVRDPLALGQSPDHRSA